jgi:hypothetical protein
VIPVINVADFLAWHEFEPAGDKSTIAAAASSEFPGRFASSRGAGEFHHHTNSTSRFASAGRTLTSAVCIPCVVRAFLTRFKPAAVRGPVDDATMMPLPKRISRTFNGLQHAQSYLSAATFAACLVARAASSAAASAFRATTSSVW